MKYSFLIYISVIVLLVVIVTQIKVPMCYHQIEKEPPITFVIYDEKIVNTMKQRIERDPFYFVEINGHSMFPAIKHNERCLCVGQSEYNVGDIVAYYIKRGVNKVELISHRIVSENQSKFKTKGDNNKLEDGWEIPEEQVFCKIPETSVLEKFKFAILGQ